MTKVVQYQKCRAVGTIILNNPPVNALSTAMRAAIVDTLRHAANDSKVEAIVLLGSGRCFSGGADIREFSQPAGQGDPILPAAIESIENCPKPVVAALHSTTFGGGMELALGCHYRIGAPSTRMAQPEVKLGIIPGAGGTQRLPRLIGVEPALEMILTGEPVDAEKALALGLLDEVVHGELRTEAVAFAEKLIAEGRPLRRARDMDEKLHGAGDVTALLANTRKGIERRARGLLAPFLCIESVANAFKLPFDDALKKERELFVRCRDSEQSKAQRYAFFAERQVSKIPDVPADTPVAAINTAAVVGAGTMGGGIAMCFANAGIRVRLLEVSQKKLDKGLATIRRNYAATVAKGRLSQTDMDARLGLINGTVDYGDIADADIVIEAVFEEMELKKQVFRTLDQVCKPAAILATNTSTLDVNEIAAATGRPERVIGTHFFSPANVMKLVENVRGAKSSKETIATVMRLSKTLGKVGVLVGVCDGFIGNRMYHTYTRQASFLLEEGALPQQIDKVIYDFGFPMGPFAVGDLAGLDIGWRIRQRRAKTRPKGERYSPIADRICEMGRFGQKTGAGWYRYESGSRTPIRDPETERLILGVSAELGIERRSIDDQEILERCVYVLINEGAKILEEGIALRASDIDLIWIYGYGFPIYRGGPMFYADEVGLKVIHDSLNRLYDIHGELLKPAPLLEKLAKQSKGFHET
ncbi:MAG: 3-hydroxyacyl-CoA dehydrogenase NAD-binding domain-containing protein [Acidiferrobacterales bacterium]|nr:3-hydroxyacyl-CoA dehydrogenase NAD-binding domain-containing protein [Acidiferrobacterales bacterium]